MPKKLGQKKRSSGSDGELLGLLQSFGSTDVDDCIEHLRSFRSKSYSRTSSVTLRKLVERALDNPRLVIASAEAPQDTVLEGLENRHIEQRSDSGARLNHLSTDSDSDSSNRPDAGGGSSSGEEFMVTAEDRMQNDVSALSPDISQAERLENGAKPLPQQTATNMLVHTPAAFASTSAVRAAALASAQLVPPTANATPTEAAAAATLAAAGKAAAVSLPAAPTTNQPPGPLPTLGKGCKRHAPTSSVTSNKKQKRAGFGKASSAVTQPRGVRYADLGGIEDVLADIRELIEEPLQNPEVYAKIGVTPPRGLLLHGPPGCGKTALANAIANQCGVPFLRISAPEIVSGMSGESEKKVRDLFKEAADCAPCIVFIDEIDAIAGKRESAQHDMGRRIVAQMLTCMDDLALEPPPQGAESQDEAQPPLDPPSVKGHVFVIGATNRPDALDAALRRAGRFDREIAMSIPSEAARASILRVLTRPLSLSGDFDFAVVAKRTPGFVGADLQALKQAAAAIAIRRTFQEVFPEADAVSVQERRKLTPQEMEGLAVCMADFEAAVKKVQPSVRREGFNPTPNVTFADVGSLDEVRRQLSVAISLPIEDPGVFAEMGLKAATGVLLYGPPGCGKTLLAKAVACESGANFISIKGPELLDKYVGESERAVRSLFSRARAAKPCILFFDEVEALASRRSSSSDSNQSSERVVNQLLTEMDGVDGRDGVFIVAATNRYDVIDPALLRPGRLDKVLYVPLPTDEGREAILRTLTRSKPLAADVDLKAIAFHPAAASFSGADLDFLVREACMPAVLETIAARRQWKASGNDTAMQLPPKACVTMAHFQEALQRVKPSVRARDSRRYEALRADLAGERPLTTKATAPQIPPPSTAIPT